MEENVVTPVAGNGENGQAAEPEAPQAAPENTERERLEQENAELQNRLLRMQAEFDNFRKRTERERMEFAEYAGEQTVLALLPVLDDFERALKAAETVEGAPAEFLKGVAMIYNRLLDTLKKQGLQPIEAQGVSFDPHQHNAIQRLETDEHEDGTVVQEYQRGYNYKGRLLRPSMVQVAVKP